MRCLWNPGRFLLLAAAGVVDQGHAVAFEDPGTSGSGIGQRQFMLARCGQQMLGQALRAAALASVGRMARPGREQHIGPAHQRVADRKSTRLNSSHTVISYAVFCLKKKTTRTRTDQVTV